jgi:hypothetical protein
MKNYYLNSVTLLSIFVLLFNQQASAYHLSGQSWPSAAYNFYINPIGVDNGIDYSIYNTTIINAAKEWEQIGTSSIQLNFEGTTSVTEWGGSWPPDYQNTITWKTNDWSGNVIGVSTKWFVGDEIVDSDIKLNTAFAGDSRLPLLVTHEVGHSLGINHTREANQSYTSEEYNAIMYYLLHNQNEMNQEDWCAITALYPSGANCAPDKSEGYHACEPCCSGETSNTVAVTISNNNKTYNGNAQSVTVTTDPAGIAHTVSYTNASAQTVNTPTNAGWYTVTVTITETGYENNGPFEGSMTINKKSLTVSANNQTTDYGSAEPSYTLSYSGFVTGEASDDLAVLPVATVAGSWPLLPGSYPIVTSGGSDENYSFSYQNGTLTVNQLIVSAVTISDTLQSYDGTAKTVNAGTIPEGVSHVLQYSQNGNTIEQPLNAGVYDVILTIDETGYASSQFISKLKIDKASLTVQAHDTSMVFGDDEPEFRISFTGFVATDDQSQIDELPLATVEGSRPLLPGEYSIQLNGGTDNNYNFELIAGKLTVESNQAMIAIEDTIKSYTGLPLEATVRTHPADIGYLVSYFDEEGKAVTNPLKPGRYTIEVVVTEPGYENLSARREFIVRKAELQVRANDQSFNYSSPLPVFSLSYSGFVNNENENSLTEAPTAFINENIPLLPGAYTIFVSGGSSELYSFVYQNGTLTVLPLEIEALMVSDTIQAYNGAEQSISVSTAPENIDFELVFDKGSKPVNAGVYPYTITITEPGYRAATFSGRFIIEKAPLYVGGDNLTIIYSDALPELLPAYSGWIGNEGPEALSEIPQIETLPNWPLDAGNYEFTFSGAEAINYEIIYDTFVMTVSRAPLTITANDHEIFYGDPLPNLSYTSDGWKYNDDETVFLSQPALNVEGTPPYEIGKHSIVISGASAVNYSCIFQNGTLTVKDHGTVAVQLNNQQFTYNGLEQYPEINTIPPGIAFQTSYAESPLDAGSYEVVVSIEEAGYPEQSYTLGFTINKAELSVSAADTAMYSHADIPKPRLLYSGWVNNEGPPVIDQLPSPTIEINWPPAGGSYPIIVAGGSDNNYDFSYHNGTLTVIQSYQLEVNAGDNGWLALNEEGSPAYSAYSQILLAGESSKTFYAFAKPNYLFDGWSNGSNSNPMQIENIASDSTITARFKLAVSNNISAQGTSLLLYPNPATVDQNIHIRLNTNEQETGPYLLIISDYTGRTLTEHREVAELFNIGKFRQGVYLLQLYDAKNRQKLAHSKFIVK